MEYKPAIFKDVPINTTEENPCSPEEPETVGININAPEEILLSKSDSNVVIPICGIYMVEMSKATDVPVKLNIKSTKTGIVFSGFMIEREENPIEPEPVPAFDEPTEEPDLTGMTFGSYFNPDLRKYVNFPPIPGEYEIYVEYSGLVSNTVNLKITIK